MPAVVVPVVVPVVVVPVVVVPAAVPVVVVVVVVPLAVAEAASAGVRGVRGAVTTLGTEEVVVVDDSVVVELSESGFPIGVELALGEVSKEAVSLTSLCPHPAVAETAAASAKVKAARTNFLEKLFTI